MFKKLLVAFMIAALSFSGNLFAGDKAKEDLEIAVVYMNITIPFAGLIKQGVDAAAKELGIDAYMTGATDWNTSSQYQVIENLVAKKVDGISVAVLDIPGLTPIINKSVESGIVTTCFNVDAPESKRMSFVGEDLFLAGKETAEVLIEYMGTKGEVIISSVAIGAIWSKKREDGVRSVLKNYPDIKIVDVINAEGAEQNAYAALENSLLAHPEVDGMISLGGTQYLWARLLQNKDMGNIKSAKPIYNTGHDLYEEKLLQIQNGWATAAFGQNPYLQGYQAVMQIYRKVMNNVDGKDIDTGVVRVDGNNAKDFIRRLYDGEPIG